ncbi:hypothetical protein [Nocardia australiensis]|uniref:hypothetical protein n=1 Tax=Nocardia australiensis TaxID=2887191 RepID=UPI001D14F8CC|nr:hypothetical protein [Nocardia australiensis]
MRNWFLGTAAAVVAAAAATALVVAVVTETRRPDDCRSVDGALVATITERAGRGPVEALVAMAVEDRFARGRSSVPYDAYYLIGIRFRTFDGATHSGVWGLGTNAADRGQDRRLAVVGPIDGTSSSLAAITPGAATWTDWPNRDIPVGETDPTVVKTVRCLS